eukprot:TRINITY_DN105786_c0_g1_i1.p1 TRINITY_DN105786_c0_g1~~TRINITY_DN105786_c0_g1_i1.p1  ORF type:complete len:342 (-),score=82.03 TRINITY_DN105786_c0_g1_i1:97-1122(-)
MDVCREPAAQQPPEEADVASEARLSSKASKREFQKLPLIQRPAIELLTASEAAWQTTVLVFAISSPLVLALLRVSATCGVVAALLATAAAASSPQWGSFRRDLALSLLRAVVVGDDPRVILAALWFAHGVGVSLEELAEAEELREAVCGQLRRAAASGDVNMARSAGRIIRVLDETRAKQAVAASEMICEEQRPLLRPNTPTSLVLLRPPPAASAAPPAPMMPAVLEPLDLSGAHDENMQQAATTAREEAEDAVAAPVDLTTDGRQGESTLAPGTADWPRCARVAPLAVYASSGRPVRNPLEAEAAADREDCESEGGLSLAEELGFVEVGSETWLKEEGCR